MNLLNNLQQSIFFPAICLTMAMLTGCSITSPRPPKHDPAYAPAKPVISQRPEVVNGTIYHISNNRFLFEDLRARRVGDTLTVVLEEKTQANKKASTSTNKNSGIDISAPTIFGRGVTSGGKPIIPTNINSNVDFSGSGDSTQSNSLDGSISVTVAEVMPNGYLLIRGEKLMTLNQGSEVVQISGIVRPLDIAPDNTIKSHKIANASITYGGKGMLADSNRAGLLTRFFNSVFWPF